MKHLILVLSLAILFTACQEEILNEDLPETNEQTTDSTNTDSTAQSNVLFESQFEDRVHPTSGTIKVIDIDNTLFLELSEFKSDNGPALYVYLSSSENDQDFTNLGELKATQGTFNYEIPAGTDLEKHHNVLIWCERFSVLFGAADLSE